MIAEKRNSDRRKKEIVIMEKENDANPCISVTLCPNERRPHSLSQPFPVRGLEAGRKLESRLIRPQCV